MPAVPLGTQAYSRTASSTPDTRLVNLYIEKDESGSSADGLFRLQRPGLTRIAADLGPIRAVYQSDNTISNIPVIVAGDQWFRLDGEDRIAIGDVEDDGDTCRIVATFERLGLVSAGKFYIWDGEAVTIVQQRDKEDADSAGITLTDLDPIIDADVLNGYFILATSNGKFYWLVPGETSVNALNFATAEALPDGCIAVRRLRDDLFFFGQNSIEVWQATGDSDLTFQRAAGRLIDRGCSSRESVAIFDNSLTWAGDDGIIYKMSDVPQRISTFGIEERIKDAIDLCSGWVFTSLGHKFYTLRIPGIGTYAFDAATQMWSEFASAGADTWLPHCGQDTATGTIAGDIWGKLYRLDSDSSLDDGAPFLRLVSGTVTLPARPQQNSSLAIGVGSDGPATFLLRWNDPRRGWSQTVDLLARGEGDILNAWRLGVARAPSRTFEVSTLAPTVIRITGAVANEAWRI
jgi:hypothetical protein